MREMRKLYGGVEGYNYEEEYGIIERTIEHEKHVLQEPPKFMHIFKGLNLVSALGQDSHRLLADPRAEKNPHCDGLSNQPATRRPRHHLHLLNL